MPTSVLTAAERAERQRLAAESIHSGEMEGLQITEAARADSEDYVAGAIDSQELIIRTRARYGLE